MRLYTLDDPGELSNAKAFLFQVAANLSIDQLRRKTLHQNYLDREGVKIPGDGSAGLSNFFEHIPLEREMEAQGYAALYLSVAGVLVSESTSGVYSQSCKRYDLR